MRSNESIRYAPAGVPISTSLVIRGRVLHQGSIIDVCHDETMITRRIRHFTGILEDKRHRLSYRKSALDDRKYVGRIDGLQITFD